MKFNQIFTAAVCGHKIRYGVVWGNEKIIFIKTGADGEIEGYGDKYLAMATRAHEKTGATVICASNPDINRKANLRADVGLIRKIMQNQNLEDCEISFIGTSDGGYHNLLLAAAFPETVRVLSINGSLINLPDLKEKLQALPNPKKSSYMGPRTRIPPT